MDMGIHETYLLVTESGKQIRTTAQHPYLTMSAKPTALIIGGTYQIDQSPRLETLTQDSYIALANKHIQFVAKISKKDKLLLKAVYNKNNKSKYYGTDVFAKSVAMLLRAAGIRDAKIQIDRDYSGHENRINEIMVILKLTANPTRPSVAIVISIKLIVVKTFPYFFSTVGNKKNTTMEPKAPSENKIPICSGFTNCPI